MREAMYKDYRPGRAAGKSRTRRRRTQPRRHSRTSERLSDLPAGKRDSAATGSAPRLINMSSPA